MVLASSESFPHQPSRRVFYCLDLQTRPSTAGDGKTIHRYYCLRQHPEVNCAFLAILYHQYAVQLSNADVSVRIHALHQFKKAHYAVTLQTQCLPASPAHRQTMTIPPAPAPHHLQDETNEAAIQTMNTTGHQRRRDGIRVEAMTWEEKSHPKWTLYFASSTARPPIDGAPLPTASIGGGLTMSNSGRIFEGSTGMSCRIRGGGCLASRSCSISYQLRYNAFYNAQCPCRTYSAGRDDAITVLLWEPPCDGGTRWMRNVLQGATH